MAGERISPVASTPFSGHGDGGGPRYVFGADESVRPLDQCLMRNWIRMSVVVPARFVALAVMVSRNDLPVLVFFVIRMQDAMPE